MVKDGLTRDDVIKMLRERQGDRTMTALALEMGVSLPYMSDVFKGNRGPGPTILRELGLAVEITTQTIYRKVA